MCQIETFCLELGKKTFWHWEWGRISTTKSMIKRPSEPALVSYLDLPERLELPERPPKYQKDQSIIGKY